MTTSLPTPDDQQPAGIRRLANWKVAVAGGALLGFGAASVIGAAGSNDVLDTEPVGAVSLREGTFVSLNSPTSTTVTVPATTTTTVAPAPAPTVAPAPAPVPAPPPAPAPSVSIDSPPRVAPAPAPVPSWSAPSWSAPSWSAPSPASAPSAVSFDSD